MAEPYQGFPVSQQHCERSSSDFPEGHLPGSKPNDCLCGSSTAGPEHETGDEESRQQPARCALEAAAAPKQPALSVLLMPRSLLVFRHAAYEECLHGIDEVGLYTKAELAAPSSSAYVLDIS